MFPNTIWNWRTICLGFFSSCGRIFRDIIVINVEDDVTCTLLSLEYLCFLTTNMLSLRFDCSARCVSKSCFHFCSVHVQQLLYWRSCVVGGPRTLWLFINWATCLKGLRTLGLDEGMPTTSWEYCLASSTSSCFSCEWVIFQFPITSYGKIALSRGFPIS